MQVKASESVKREEIAPGISVRWVISEKDGANNFYMRIFDLNAEAEVQPAHSHPYEHEIYIISGRGTFVGETGSMPFKTGDVIFIPANESHQVIQKGNLCFICLIPAHK